MSLQRNPSWHFVAALALFACALPAAAQWTGKGEAGMAVASGNSDSKTANAKVAIAHKADAWEETAGFGTLYVRNNGTTTANRWELSGQTRYTFSGTTYWYGGARYEEDHFSGFDHDGVATTGIGHRFFDSDETRLSAQVGVGYKFFKTTPPGSYKDGSLTEVAGLDFKHKLTDSTTVFDKFGSEFSSSNDFLQNELGISVKVSDRLALSVAYAVRHNSDPPAGFKKTDKLSTVNLVYEVK